MRFYFTKMQGLGNDYIYLNCFDERMQEFLNISQNRKAELAVRMSRRHTGIGADGLIFIMPSEKADCRMEMYNADGSRGAMCGNGIRCVARYVRERGIVQSDEMSIETDSGIRQIFVRRTGDAGVQLPECGYERSCDGENIGNIRVDMGPVMNMGERQMRLNGHLTPIQMADVGNSHCVIFVENIVDFPLKKTAEAIEAMPEFAEGINIEIATVEVTALTGEKHIDMRVYERGTGETMACGTGACAVCAAAVWQGYCRYDEDVAIVQPGGRLITAYLADGRMMMEGPAEFVFEGIWEA